MSNSSDKVVRLKRRVKKPAPAVFMYMLTFQTQVSSAAEAARLMELSVPEARASDLIPDALWDLPIRKKSE